MGKGSRGEHRRQAIGKQWASRWQAVVKSGNLRRSVKPWTMIKTF